MTLAMIAVILILENRKASVHVQHVQGGRLTHLRDIARNAKTRHKTLATNGALLVPVYQTRALLTSPDTTAVILFSTVMNPRRPLKSVPFLGA